MWRTLVRFLKYSGTSLAGTLVDTLVLWILSDLVFTKGYWGEYVVSPAISFQCAVITNFLISYFYVWKDRKKTRNPFLTFLYYDLSCTAVFLLRLGFLLLVERIFGWDVVICNLVAMCVTGIINFVMNNQVIFRKRH
ncbi:MAG: GtrA family protein [Bacteroidales bacterium]|nr:GtrA family protein [Bacteroidales bacterium]